MMALARLVRKKIKFILTLQIITYVNIVFPLVKNAQMELIRVARFAMTLSIK